MHQGAITNRMALFLCAILLWLLNHPLPSIDYHDAIIYSILALHKLNPVAYARDPFFMFGSQDSFSLFSSLYAPLVGQFGLTVAAASVLLLGGVLWCVAAMTLAHTQMREGWQAGTAVLLTAILSINYSPNGTTFLLNEGFATARSLAFPLGMLALAACAAGRHPHAWACALTAFLFHPLIGVWAVLFVLFWQLPGCTTHLLMGIGALLLAALMAAEVGPFARFDADWELILRQGTRDVFVNPFPDMRWRDHALQLMTLVLAGLHLGRGSKAGRLYCLVALLASTGLLASMIASYFWPSRIMIQAQLWRSMWLAACAMPFAACHLLWFLWERLGAPEGGRPWLLTAVLGLLFLMQFGLAYVLAAWVLLLCLYLSGVQREWFARLYGRAMQLHDQPWLPWFSLALIALALPNLWQELSLLEGRVVLPFDSPFPLFSGLLVHGGAGLGAALIAIALYKYGSKIWLSMALSICVVLSLVHWDMRNVRDKVWGERAAFGAHDAMSELIGSGEVVLWDGRMPVNTWYELRTASYASPVQAIGMVFSREKTFELLSRARRIQEAYEYEVGSLRKNTQSGGAEHPFAFNVPRGKGIPVLCQDANLDWVIVPLAKLPDLAGWRVFPNPYARTASESSLYVFACGQFRT